VTSADGGAPDPDRGPRRARAGRVAAGGALVVLAALTALAIMGARAPWSASGWALLAALALGAAAGICARSRARRALGALAAAALLALGAVRVAAGSRDGARVVTLPGGASSRWLARLVDEQDVSLLGARLLLLRWPLIRDERPALVAAIHDTYAEMHDDVGLFPSPVLDTLLRRQSPRAFDTLVLEPRAAARAGVVFLHGYAGSFTFECWLVAKAAQAIDAVTVCPATDFSGLWGGRDGERTLRVTLDYLRGRGIGRVYLVGLSNGAVGAAALAPRFAPSLAGLILISGAPAGGPDPRVPTLVIHGDRDPMASARAARAYAARTHASYAGFDGGHFVLLMRRAETGRAIAAWLRGREARR
jgi:hypothetical protein